MNEQWEELKETIIELRDNDGIGTQQEVCGFLANLMDVLEKQVQKPCEDVMSRQAVTKIGWIPVSERLPEDKQSVLVWCPQYKNIYCSYREKEQWWIFGAFVQIVPNEVIAWMPLPEPYKESEG